MKFFLKLALFLIIVLSISCSSVRTRSKASKSKSGSNQPSNVDRKQFEPAGFSEDRFSDTTVIIVQPSARTQQNNLVSQFEKAADEFDNEQYEEACGKFELFAETFAKNDSLHYESLFYQSECLILENKLERAAGILNNIWDSPAPEAVKEKAIVRIGQIHCVNGKEQQAQEMFDLLKNRYPGSIYLPLANCEAIK